MGWIGPADAVESLLRERGARQGVGPDGRSAFVTRGGSPTFGLGGDEVVIPDEVEVEIDGRWENLGQLLTEAGVGLGGIKVLATREKRGRREPEDWRSTPVGRAKYLQRRAEAQQRANATGMDHAVEANDYAKDFTVSMLPGKKHRAGHELRVEVVHPEDLSKTRPGHGPGARATREGCGCG